LPVYPHTFVKTGFAECLKLYYRLVINDKHVEYGIAISILAVGIRAFGQHQSIAFLLAETSGKRERIFTPVDVTKEFESWVNNCILSP
jgi:hypothetical protein